ncbi:MAG: DUF4405 domain-containing protein [Bacillota bacterium]|nr:DUF4405 domain-containing protein [Bacillota bacterium]
MNKARTNFIIDAVMFLGMMALVGTGYVRKYVVLSGSVSREVYGRKVHMALMGVDRDGWSVIHLYLGYFLLALLVLHIVLHWKQIKAIYSKWIPDSGTRLVITILFVIISVLLVIFPFIISPVII